MLERAAERDGAVPARQCSTALRRRRRAWINREVMTASAWLYAMPSGSMPASGGHLAPEALPRTRTLQLAQTGAFQGLCTVGVFAICCASRPAFQAPQARLTRALSRRSFGVRRSEQTTPLCCRRRLRGALRQAADVARTRMPRWAKTVHDGFDFRLKQALERT